MIREDHREMADSLGGAAVQQIPDELLISHTDIQEPEWVKAVRLYNDGPHDSMNAPSEEVAIPKEGTPYPFDDIELPTIPGWDTVTETKEIEQADGTKVVTKRQYMTVNWRANETKEPISKDEELSVIIKGEKVSVPHLKVKTAYGTNYKPQEPAKQPSIKPAETPIEQVQAERGSVYGDSQYNLGGFAQAISGYLTNKWQMALPSPVTEFDAAMIMELGKVIRMAYTPGHADSLLDAHSYLDLGAKAVQRATT